jgi:hypothetical protein
MKTLNNKATNVVRLDKYRQARSDKKWKLSLVKEWVVTSLIFLYFYILWVVFEWAVTHTLPAISPR